MHILFSFVFLFCFMEFSPGEDINVKLNVYKNAFSIIP